MRQLLRASVRETSGRDRAQSLIPPIPLMQVSRPPPLRRHRKRALPRRPTQRRRAASTAPHALRATASTRAQLVAKVHAPRHRSRRRHARAPAQQRNPAWLRPRQHRRARAVMRHPAMPPVLRGPRMQAEWAAKAGQGCGVRRAASLEAAKRRRATFAATRGDAPCRATHALAARLRRTCHEPETHADARTAASHSPQRAHAP